MIGKIYIIKSKQTDKVYIGPTFLTLNRRFGKHKVDKDCTSVEILKYSDAKIELLECYECEHDEELELREAYYIREYKKNNLCVNRNIPRRTDKEYREDNKEKMKEYQKEYREKNKQELAEKKKEYRQENKEILAKKANEKFTCECGSICRKLDKVQHFKTKKHQDYFKD